MSRTIRKSNEGNIPDKDRFTRNKKNRDIGQNKRIKKDYLKFKDLDDDTI